MSIIVFNCNYPLIALDRHILMVYVTLVQGDSMEDNKKSTIQPGNENFAELLEKSFIKRSRLEPGQRIEASIVKISSDWIFLHLGGKGEGYLDKKELLDESGTISVKEGDVISVYFLNSENNELHFTTKIGAGPGVRTQIENAWHAGIPVEGTITKEVKGGFEVKIGTVRAFCPFSQTGLRRNEQKSDYIGKSLSFRIAEYGENGRNIVLSRKAIVEEEQQKKQQQLRESLKEGMRVRGKVTSIQKFGAFVDIGGLEGLIPISEIAWGRTDDISDVMSVGQEVEVIVKSMDWNRGRISFSLKETLTDPWLNVVEECPVGSYHSGTVARLAGFGAFVTLTNGLDGLIHISKLGGEKRISHPREVLKEGQTVEVRIEAVDREKRKLSLSLAEVSREEEEAAASLEMYQKKASSDTMGTFGDLLKEQMKNSKKG